MIQNKLATTTTAKSELNAFNWRNKYNINKPTNRKT